MKVLKEIAVTALAAMTIGVAVWRQRWRRTPRTAMPPMANASTWRMAALPVMAALGQGGAYNTPAPILAHTAVPFDGFKGQVRNPINDMPAFPSALLSDKDIADIYAFVKSLPGPRSPKDFPS